MVLTPLHLCRRPKNSLTLLPPTRYIGFGATKRRSRLAIQYQFLPKTSPNFQC
jgi:hypothetical protein